MRRMSLDIETYSSVDLRNASVYRYAEAEDFQILLLAYSFEDGPVHLIDLTEQEIPKVIIGVLTDPNVIKSAFNANFERVCLGKHLGVRLDPRGWHCTMVHAASLGLPRSLAEVGSVLGLPEDKQKMKEGKALIQYFCKPCKPTKSNGGRTRNLPSDAPEKWETFKEYNIRDVETEMAIARVLDAYPLPPDEVLAYCLDQDINDRGVGVDLRLAEKAIEMNGARSKQLTDEAVAITGLDNVGSVAQLKGWLGVEGSLDKKAIKAMRGGGLSDAQDRVLAIRQELGKTSVSKYEAMLRGVCHDGRIHGLFAFYGASRTGRWSAKYVQTQNLPQNHLEDLDEARQLVLDGDLEAVKMLYGSVQDTLSQLIRTAFIPRPGNTFVVADFSAIEARVVAWLADEKWRQEVFANGGDIYCASASQMFHVPVVKHGINGHLRQKGKIAELALGYGGSVGALTNMGALEMGLKEEELKPLVEAWREANPGIVRLWWDLDRAAKDTIRESVPMWRHDLPHGLSMKVSKRLLHVLLPSGRCLRYWEPKLEDGKYDQENISYGSTEAGNWRRVMTYGPKLLENITQAIARDCLRDAMLEVRLRYPDIVMHIHDEMVVEVPKKDAEIALKDILGIMAQPVPWAPGLKLKGDGYITEYYKKD